MSISSSEYRQIQSSIEEIKERCSKYLGDEEESREKENGTNPNLEIKAFENVVKECKEQIESSDEEHMQNMFKLLYGIDTQNALHSEYTEKMDEIVNMYINDGSGNSPTEDDIEILKSSLEEIDVISGTLIREHKRLKKEDKKLFSFKSSKITKIIGILEELQQMQKKLNFTLELYSKKISKTVIENFYNIFIFFSFLIKVSMAKKNQLLLIETGHNLDRIIDIMTPSFNQHNLENKHLLYHYVVFEFKNLKNLIFY